jgi:predicted deacylase
MALNIRVEEFNPKGLASPGKSAFFLEFCPPGSGENLGIPLLLANGRMSGKTLVVFAGVHGDELEGVQTIHEVFHQLDPDTMSGKVFAVPVANLPAYRAVRRTSPIDSLNLARTFPGRSDGTVTERIAFYLSEIIIPCADFFIDLHSAGLTYLLPTMVGYDASDSEQGKISKGAALRFGMPVMWGHPEISPGRSLCVAIERRIPWLYVEAPSGGRVSQSDLTHYIGGLLNLLKYLEIIPGAIEQRPPKYHLIGTGDLDRTVAVNTSGFFVPRVQVLDNVEPNQVLGIVRDIFGETIEEIRTIQGGCVGMLRAIPLVSPGDSVCLLVDAVQEE